MCIRDRPRCTPCCPGSDGRSGVGLVIGPLFQVRKKRARTGPEVRRGRTRPSPLKPASTDVQPED
eukprot:11414874-Alexandrium_andersonii.AAC.1